jgi:hypothetical protein
MVRKLINLKELIEGSTDLITKFNELRDIVLEGQTLDPMEIYIKEQTLIDKLVDFFYHESDILNNLMSHPEEEISKMASLRANEISSMLRTVNMHQTKYNSPLTIKNCYETYKLDFEFIYEKFIRRYESDMTQLFESTDLQDLVRFN